MYKRVCRSHILLTVAFFHIQYSGPNKAALDNRANQLNPNHVPSGPGRSAGYHGAGNRADLNNHANQLNPNNHRDACEKVYTEFSIFT